MKKILFTATMLVGFAAVSQAQQGRFGINTVTPAATVDIVATPANTALPDALLVPRMTRSQLQGKDAAFAAAQNGALAFVTTIDGSATGKVINVATPGFYYYDGTTTNLWVAVGGGAAPVGMTVRAQTAATISNADLGNAIVVTSNVTFDLSTLTKTNGKTITFIDATTGGTGFSVIGVHPTSQAAPLQGGGALSYICDGTAWYNYNGY